MLLISSLLTGLLLLQQGASVPLEAAACPNCSPFTTPDNKDHYKFAVIGDSFASGVSYSSASEYDHNKDQCLRSTDTHGVQMKNNHDWTTKGVQFDFAACSGTKMIDMAKGGREIDHTTDPDLVIMTVGGNNAGFFNVIDSCVYHSNTKIDYGPDYDKDPQRVGLCAKAIDFAKNYILSEKDDGLRKQLRDTYNDLLISKAYKSNPELRIYQTGYVHYFNVKPDGDWCNSTRFIPFRSPTLSRLVRLDINDLVDNGNRVIKEVTAEYADKHVGYVSITEGFNKQRFCEGESNWWQQYKDDYVWLWNILPPGLSDRSVDDPNALFALLSSWNTVGGPVLNSGGRGDSKDGWKMRPFHPKKKGYESIMNSTIAQLRADKVPGIKS